MEHARKRVPVMQVMLCEAAYGHGSSDGEPQKEHGPSVFDVSAAALCSCGDGDQDFRGDPDKIERKPEHAVRIHSDIGSLG